MNTFNKIAKRLLIISILLVAVLSFSACSEDPVSPQLENISGKWDGQFNHPGYDGGSITLNVLENNSNLSGSFVMRLVKSNRVSNFGGSITGAKVTNNEYNLNLNGTNFTFICDLNLNSKELMLSGNWESEQQNGISGTISVQKD